MAQPLEEPSLSSLVRRQRALPLAELPTFRFLRFPVAGDGSLGGDGLRERSSHKLPASFLTPEGSSTALPICQLAEPKASSADTKNLCRSTEARRLARSSRYDNARRMETTPEVKFGRLDVNCWPFAKSLTIRW